MLPDFRLSGVSDHFESFASHYLKFNFCSSQFPITLITQEARRLVQRRWSECNLRPLLLVLQELDSPKKKTVSMLRRSDFMDIWRIPDWCINSKSVTPLIWEQILRSSSLKQVHGFFPLKWVKCERSWGLSLQANDGCQLTLNNHHIQLFYFIWTN